MASQESIALLLLSLDHKVAPHLFSEPPRPEPCLICKQEIIDSHAMFRCGHSFHIKCCRATSVRSEQCPECRDHNMEQPERLKDMRREEKLLALYLCRKIGKADSETIYWYYEFGLALTIRLNELIENGQKRVRKKLNDEVHRHFSVAIIKIK
ncbi:hypothetical protein Glove_242g97 [Diversispora epigaea]|uniref:RING-type domain-containing protein n=1 Tax=Diversispora epigaea TaxID=1348612 RepID=A0A397IA85_9GLOM|nr:hypothetical protein Glove_242g97 [Diversispora epigaea]